MVETADVVVVAADPLVPPRRRRSPAPAATWSWSTRRAFPRDKFCGDGLTAGALRLLERLGLDPAAVPSWHQVDDVVVRSPSGREVTFPLPRGRGSYAVIARRVELDAALLDVARAAGAKVLDGHACIGASERDDRIVVDVEATGRGARPLRRGRRRHVVAAAQAPGRGDPRLPGRVARLPPVLHRCRRASLVGSLRVVRTRPAAGLRMVVPAARRPSQRRLRDPPRRRQGGTCPGHEAALAGPAAHDLTSPPCSVTMPVPSRPTGPGPSPVASTTSCWRRAAPPSSATPPRRATP